MMYDDRQSLIGLRRRWLLVAAFYSAVLLLVYWFLLTGWSSGRPMQWLGIAVITMLIQLGILWWALQHNHRPYESVLLPFIGYSNGMTLTRGLLTCLLAGFLFAPRPIGALAWLPTLLYTLERLIDYFDGYVARITRNETKLGAILDMEFDSLGFLIAITLAIQYGQLPIWYLLLGVARQLFLAGMWLRNHWKLPVYDLPPTYEGRIVAGFQTGFISVALWPVLSAQSTRLACLFFAVPLLLSFGRDWLVVSGVIDAGSASYQRVRQAAREFLLGWVPLVARILGGTLALAILWQAAPDFRAWSAYLGELGIKMGGPPLMTLALLWGLAALLMLAGLVGRAGALLLIFLAFLDLQANGLRWSDNGLLLVCAIIVAHAGSGKFAQWRPEERLMRIKLGAPYSPDKPPAR